MAFNSLYDLMPGEPKSALGRYRLLAPSASIRVSPLCLGAMNFGEAWEGFMGACDKNTTFEMLDFFYDMGGNFIDTANNYQNQESEIWIGEWMAKRGSRDDMVIATKYTTPYRSEGKASKGILANTAGNGLKSMHVSIEQSLKKLQTSYIDILYVHWWDYTASVAEVMQGLNRLVSAGKVLYLGISDTPAWIVSKANEYARQNGMAQFVVYQGLWSAEKRDFERDIIPMCRAEGMGLAPWGALGRGHFKTDEQRKKTGGRNMSQASEAAIKISKVLERMANEKGVGLTAVAIAYVMHKTPYVFPICGGRSVEQLKGNIEALYITMSEEEIEEIESLNEFDIGFPQSMMGKKAMKGPGDVYLVQMAGQFDYVDSEKPITHGKKQGGKK